MKKITSFFLAFLMCFSVIAPAFAAFEEAEKIDKNINSSVSIKAVTGSGSIDGLQYEIIDRSYVRITDFVPKYDGVDLEIPSLIDGYPVEMIDHEAFYNNNCIKTVKIPHSVTSIGARAFSGSKSITSIVIPDSVTRIDSYAFEFCTNLTSITIPASVESIGKNVFRKCDNLTIYGEAGSYAEEYANANNIAFVATVVETPEPTPTVVPYTYSVIDDSYAEITRYNNSPTAVIIPDEIDGYPVKSIKNNAFADCPFLTSITLGNNVEYIDDYTFAKCHSLTNIYVPESNKYYSDTDGVLFNKDKTKIIRYPVGKTESTYIFPDSVMSTAYGAFDEAMFLTDITISDNVTSMEERAFLNCENLKSVVIGSGLTTLEKLTFSDCKSLTDVTIGENVKNINESAFSGCESLKNIEIPNGVTRMGLGVFSDCTALTSIEIPDSVTSMEEWMFRDCNSLKNVKLPSGIIKLGDRTFQNCTALENIEIPDSVEYIGWLAFSGCTALKNITIPYSVRTIEKEAFSGCSGFTVYGQSLSYAEEYAKVNNIPFVAINMETPELTPNPTMVPTLDPTIEQTPTPISDFIYHIGEYGGILEEGQPRNYAVIQSYKGSDAVVVIPSEIEGAPVIIIGDKAFYEQTNLTNVIIPNTVTEVGERTFEYCTALRSVEICDGAAETRIEYNAFNYCISLTNVKIGSGVKYISGGAFGYCRSLENITLPDSVTSIDNAAFIACTSLKSITIPESVTRIGNNAFSGCEKLTIYGASNSYAEKYAVENGIPFIATSVGVFDIILKQDSRYSLDEETDILSGVNANTIFSEFVSNFENIEDIAVTKPDGQAVTDENERIGTGYIVMLLNDNGGIKDNAVVVIMGDVGGDGMVNSRDIATLQKHLTETKELLGVLSLAADLKADGTLNSRDIAALQKKIIGL